MGDTFTEGGDRWNIPDDRQLALRGRLETGWSSYRHNSFIQNAPQFSLSEEEQELILIVLQRKEFIQLQEQYRVGKLVKKLEHMKKNILGDGVSTCLICGTKAGLLKDSLHFCGNCGKMVCAKCSIEVRPPCDGCGKYFLCVLCNEDKMLWKRSGAWFYNAMPKYIEPENSKANNNSIYSSPASGGRMHSVHGRPYGSLSVASSLRSGLSYVDLQSQDSIDEGSDDSDIEHTSAKAFEIPEDKRSMAHYINTDEDSRSLKSNSPDICMQHGSADRNPSIIFPCADDVDSPKQITKIYSGQHSINTTGSRGGCNDFDRDSMASGSSSPKNSRIGIGVAASVFQKINRDDYPDGNLHNSKSNGHLSDKSSSTNSNGSLNSDQDIDAMFQSYEEDKSGSGEKEYHGQYGMIKFTVQYDPNTQELLIIIGSCKGLKSGDKGNIPNPYVKTVILPISPDAAKASKKRTPTMKKTPDPVFNFSMVYPGISDTDIETKGIKLSVMDETNFGNNIIIGETCIPIKGLGKRPVQQFRRILDTRANDETIFMDTKKTESNPGRIELALHYLSKQEKLVVGIIRCVGLRALDPNGYSDPYVKCYLYPDPNKKTKRKTVVKKKTLNPEFNQEFQYDISHNELAKRTLYISVWDHDVGRSNDFIGGISLGIESSGEVLRHWFDTLKTADRRVIRWHNLSSENCPIIE